MGFNKKLKVYLFLKYILMDFTFNLTGTKIDNASSDSIERIYDVKILKMIIFLKAIIMMLVKFFLIPEDINLLLDYEMMILDNVEKY